MRAATSLCPHCRKGRTTSPGAVPVTFRQTRPLKSYDVYWYHVSEWADGKISIRRDYYIELHVAVRPLNHVRKKSFESHRRKYLHDKWRYGNNIGPHLDHSHDMGRLGYLRRWNGLIPSYSHVLAEYFCWRVSNCKKSRGYRTETSHQDISIETLA